MVQGWYDKTPANFSFCLKVPQAITHEKLLHKCEQEVEGFLAAAKFLKEKLACCVLQFGYFNKKAFASAEQFMERLDPFLAAWPTEFPVAVEIRNKTWVKPQYLDCLAPTPSNVRFDRSGLDADTVGASTAFRSPSSRM
jgi:uncharacterized protein YecE (DUF72 family)